MSFRPPAFKTEFLGFSSLLHLRKGQNPLGSDETQRLSSSYHPDGRNIWSIGYIATCQVCSGSGAVIRRNQSDCANSNKNRGSALQLIQLARVQGEVTEPRRSKLLASNAGVIVCLWRWLHRLSIWPQIESDCCVGFLETGSSNYRLVPSDLERLRGYFARLHSLIHLNEISPPIQG